MASINLFVQIVQTSFAIKSHKNTMTHNDKGFRPLQTGGKFHVVRNF